MTVLLALSSLAQSSFAGGPEVVNLQQNAIRFEATTYALAYLVPESPLGSPDLNGDGDRTDWVLHVTDVRTRVTSNFGLAADLTGALSAAGRWIAFLVDEGFQGHTDLNGDGDASDQVLHLYESRRGRMINLGVAATSFELGEQFLAFSLSEAKQGAVDRNGDGDTSDQILQAFELPSLRPVSFGLATGPGNYQLRGERIAFGVFEGAQTASDLNADGDVLDLVLHVAKPRTGAVVNLKRALPLVRGFELEPPLLGYRVNEDAQRMDANGDGDRLDEVMEVFDFDSGRTHPLLLACVQFDLSAEGAALLVFEQAQGGLDLNGDGDALDRVLFAWSPSAGTPRNLGQATSALFALAGASLAYLVDERAQASDLNGDGDLGDFVAHVHDLPTGATRNVALGCTDLRIDGVRLVLRVGESQQGVDLSGNGLATDFVLHLTDLATGTTTNLGLAASLGLQLHRRTLAFSRSEPGNGLDLNGDGDALDPVVHLLDLPTGALTNLGLASDLSVVPTPLVLREGTLLLQVAERLQGGVDLNGDGDALDSILHAVLGVPR
ncbi:MAG: hypothetical protein HOP15_04890 [Planctomycetes bacterium]|nr:hypothetical protein [Planctomycetota bacterium]